MRVRKVLRPEYIDGYPPEEEVPNVDLLAKFDERWDAMCRSGELPPSRLPKPSDSTVLREVGRKE
jgi:hypothetical protein